MRSSTRKAHDLLDMILGMAGLHASMLSGPLTLFLAGMQVAQLQSDEEGHPGCEERLRRQPGNHAETPGDQQLLQQSILWRHNRRLEIRQE